MSYSSQHRTHSVQSQHFTTRWMSSRSSLTRPPCIFSRAFVNFTPKYEPLLPSQDHNLILRTLTGSPFEPLATCSLLCFLMKVAFLVAVTSARKVGKQGALMAHPAPHNIFQKQIYFKTTSQVLTKSCILIQSESAHSSPKPQENKWEAVLPTLNVQRVLAFYIERTKNHQKISENHQNYFFPSQNNIRETPYLNRLSTWMSSCIDFCPQQKLQPPQGTRTHLTRAPSASIAFFNNVPIMDICKAATWAPAHIFTQHYAIEQHSSLDALFGLNFIICHDYNSKGPLFHWGALLYSHLKQSAYRTLLEEEKKLIHPVQ